jgi:hypothetical protein
LGGGDQEDHGSRPAWAKSHPKYKLGVMVYACNSSYIGRKMEENHAQNQLQAKQKQTFTYKY